MPVQFDNEVCLANAQTIVAGVFRGGGESKFVGQFKRAGQEPGGKDGLQRADGLVHGIKPNGHGRAIRRQRNQFEGRLGDDAQQPLGADEQFGQIKAGLVFVGPSAGANDRAIGQDDLKPQDILARNAVFEAARAAGIGGQVAADEIFRAARRIGRVKQLPFFHLRLEVCSDDGGLHDGDEISLINLQNPIHPLRGKGDAAPNRNATSHVAMAGAAGGHGNFMLVGEFQDFGNRLNRAGQGNGIGLMRGEPFVPGVIGEFNRFKGDFAGQQPFQAQQSRGRFHFDGRGGAVLWRSISSADKRCSCTDSPRINFIMVSTAETPRRNFGCRIVVKGTR